MSTNNSTTETVVVLPGGVAVDVLAYSGNNVLIRPTGADAGTEPWWAHKALLTVKTREVPATDIMRFTLSQHVRAMQAAYGVKFGAGDSVTIDTDRMRVTLSNGAEFTQCEVFVEMSDVRVRGVDDSLTFYNVYADQATITAR